MGSKAASKKKAKFCEQRCCFAVNNAFYSNNAMDNNAIRRTTNAFYSNNGILRTTTQFCGQRMHFAATTQFGQQRIYSNNAILRTTTNQASSGSDSADARRPIYFLLNNKNHMISCRDVITSKTTITLMLPNSLISHR